MAYLPVVCGAGSVVAAFLRFANHELLELEACITLGHHGKTHSVLADEI